MPVTVRDLKGGDVVELGDRSATFIGRSDHPKFIGLALVIWKLDDGSFSFDALAYRQEVGEVISSSVDWKLRLKNALMHRPEGSNK